MKRLFIAMAAALLLSLSLTPSPAVAQQSTKKAVGIIIEWDDSMKNVTDSLGQDVASKFKLFGVFIHLGNENDFPAEQIPDGMTALVFFEAMNYEYPASDPRQKQFAYDAILAGKWDTYFKGLAQQMKEHERPIILNLFPEMNGDWTPSSLSLFGNTAKKHIAAYRKIREIFRQENAINVKFGWCVNRLSVPENLEGNTIEDLYPGPSDVDVLGVNGFGWGKLSFAETFDNALSALKKLKREAAQKGLRQELHIMSMATIDGPSKAGWMENALSSIEADPEIDGVSIFAITKKEDFAKRIVKWGPDSDKATKAIFQKAILRMAK